MGIAGWHVLSTYEKLRGTVVSTNYSGGSGLFSDYDWNVTIQPDPDYAYLAVNSNGATNANGQIECEIHINSSRVDALYWSGMFDRLALGDYKARPYSVEVSGVWCEDRSHSDKTEIHPMQTLEAFVVDDAHGPSWWVNAFSESWNFIPAQPMAPPADHESVTAIFALPWPGKPAATGNPVSARYDDQNSMYASLNYEEAPGQQYTVTVETGPAGYYSGVVTLWWQKNKEKEKEKEHKDGKDGKEKDGGHGRETQLHHHLEPILRPSAGTAQAPAGTQSAFIPKQDRPLEP